MNTTTKSVVSCGGGGSDGGGSAPVSFDSADIPGDVVPITAGSKTVNVIYASNPSTDIVFPMKRSESSTVMGKMGVLIIEPYDESFNEIAEEFNARPFTGALDLMMGDRTLVTDTPEIPGLSKDEMENWKPRNPCCTAGLLAYATSVLFSPASFRTMCDNSWTRRSRNSVSPLPRAVRIMLRLCTPS